MCCGVEGMQRVLMKWDGRSGGSHFQFAFPKIQLWHQLAEKAGVTVSLDMYQNRSAWLPYVSRLQEFTTFSISVWYRMKKVHLPLSCILTFLHIYKNKKKKICFYSNEQLEKHRYWQNPSNFLKQLTGILKDSAMLTGGYGHVTASTHSSVFYHVISVFRLLIFLFFFFLIGKSTVWATLSWREECSDGMFWVTIILDEVHFILFCFIYFSWDTSRPGELLKNRVIPTASQISSKSSKTGELIWQKSSGSQCKWDDNRILL